MKRVSVDKFFHEISILSKNNRPKLYIKSKKLPIVNLNELKKIIENKMDKLINLNEDEKHFYGNNFTKECECCKYDILCKNIIFWHLPKKYFYCFNCAPYRNKIYCKYCNHYHKTHSN